MKTVWDYSDLAKAYLKRPEYASEVIDEIIQITQISKQSRICDVGAGVAHLTLEFATRGYTVTAVEPNDRMRTEGILRTSECPAVDWVEATGENTKQLDDSFDIVTFGSSFNVCDRTKALQEAKRILSPKKWIVLMWNHRDLDDPIQSKLEKVIHNHLPSYAYGVRREDQTRFLENSEFFSDIEKISGSVSHTQAIVDVVEAWRSHATLKRQAGNKFESIIQDIELILGETGNGAIEIPYTTRAWLCRYH